VLLGKKPDLTLKELRRDLGLDCSVQAIHVVLGKMGLTYKKRRSGPPSRTARMSAGSGATGAGGKAGSIRRGSSSSTNRARKRT
jgi:hypothetical protein